MVIGDILDRNLWRYPEKTAIVFEDMKFTYSELGTRTYQLANALSDLGLRKGDAVAFMLPFNMALAQEIVFALAVSGMIIVPLNARFLAEELIYLVDKCDVKALIYEKSFRDLIASNRERMKGIQFFIRIGDSSGAGVLDYDELITQGSTTKPDIGVHENDIAALIHTSGTTGKPKEVIWTHRSWLAGSKDVIIRLQLVKEDRLLIFTPYFHIPFYWFNMAILYMGGAISLIRESAPALILDTIQKERITAVSHFVPTTLLRLLDYPGLGSYDFSSVRWIIYGGAAMALPLVKRAISQIGNKFIQLYGFTEQAGCVSALPPEDHVIPGTEKKVKRLSSCGKEMPSNDIRIVNEQGELLPPGEQGELIVRGDNVMKGYWKEPEETARVLKNGWFYSGDTGFMDEDGYIYLTGRKKDIIISGGENITPKQVEDVIHAHPAVEEAAVIGVPDPMWGEAVKAVVVLKKDRSATEDQIIRLCKEHLAHYKAPKSVVFLDSLPVTHTGKIKRWELKERYTQD